MLKINTKVKTEAEIQFSLSEILKKNGYFVFIERSFELPILGKTRNKNKTISIRCDIVIANANNEVIGVVEVKNHKKPTDVRKTRQYLKYKMLGVPFCYCWNEKYFPKVLKFCKSL